MPKLMKEVTMQPEPRAEEPVDGRRIRGARTRDLVIAEAIQLASVEGLEGLSIARLAARLGTAKSSVHTAFGSKESLQLAVIRETREILIELVVRPSLAAEAGHERLIALGEAWMSYLERDTFEGGCLLSSASAEMDGRPGPVRNAIADAMKEWLDLISSNVCEAIAAGELSETVVPKQLAFELNAIGMAANWHHQLFGGDEVLRMGRSAWENMIVKYRS